RRGRLRGLLRRRTRRLHHHLAARVRGHPAAREGMAAEQGRERQGKEEIGGAHGPLKEYRPPATKQQRSRPWRGRRRLPGRRGTRTGGYNVLSVRDGALWTVPHRCPSEARRPSAKAADTSLTSWPRSSSRA